MDNFSVLIPMINALLPSSVPKFTVEDAVRNSLRFFCEKTLVLTRLVEINTVIGQRAYDLSSLTDQAIVSITKVSNQNNEKLTPLVLIDSHSHKGRVQAYTSKRPGVIEFYPEPDVIEPVSITVAVKPTISSTVVENWLIDSYAEIIRDGAVGFLLSQSGTDWYEENRAKIYMQQFESAVSTIHLNLSNGFVSNSTETATGGVFF